MAASVAYNKNFERAMAEAKLDEEFQNLRKNVLAEIGRRFIARPEDREIYARTGELAAWEPTLGRYRFFYNEKGRKFGEEDHDQSLGDHWREVWKTGEAKTARGRLTKITKLAKKWGVL